MNSNAEHPAALAPEQVQHLIDKHLAHYPLQGRPVNTLSGIELEYWAALALDHDRPVIVPAPSPVVVYIGPSQNPDDRKKFQPLTDPALIAEIIAQQQVKLHPVTDFWIATSTSNGKVVGLYGDTAEEAALRCVIAAHLGPEVNAHVAYWSDQDREAIHFNENDRAARERLSVAHWLQNRSQMTPEKLAQEAEWFANGVEPIPGRPGGWLINRPRPAEWWAEIDRQAVVWLAEFRNTHPDPEP